MGFEFSLRAILQFLLKQGSAGRKEVERNSISERKTKYIKMNIDDGMLSNSITFKRYNDKVS